ncbi:MAG: hypothetical protein K1X94_16080 [Sandaracinaceae bacterium]|nr:hypothetical protein [Sandaracinaceae bacterium]
MSTLERSSRRAHGAIRVRVVHLRAALVASAIALHAAGCGAKSGLDQPRFDAGHPDAATPLDAFVLPDAAPECRNALACDDGLVCSDDTCVEGHCRHEYFGDRCNDDVFCNGLEQCVPGAGCVSPGRLCDDTVACTIDRCDEALARCTAEAEDTLCPLSFRCDVSRGCLARALVHDAANLFEIDLPSGELRRIGMFPVHLNDIALAPDGTFYGASTDVAALVRVDYRTVTYEIVAPVTGSFNALDVSPDGTLYGAADELVYAFDVAAGSTRVVARLPADMISSGDLAFVGDRLFSTVRPATLDVVDSLVEVDLATGRSAIIGEMGVRCVWALAPLGPALYALTCEGRLLEVDLATGLTTELSIRPEQGYWGAASR